MKYQAVIFDLDGTLVNSLDDLAESVNHGLRQLNLPTHEPASYRKRVGDGVRKLIERSLPDDRQDLAEQLLGLHSQYYAEHYADSSRPYPGVPEMLDQLKQSGRKLAVLSNKGDGFTQEVVARLLGREYFDCVWGHRDGYALKPVPGAALAIAEEMQVAPSKVAYVGDSAVDMKTATSAGFFPVGVTWGFRCRTELILNGAVGIIEHPLQLPKLLDI
ncbi:MAG: HAD family hydrolase [Sedimentisphaerales bacterium]|nr:HAD family hydrolase [Sedimentisphaerales bacterium]